MVNRDDGNGGEDGGAPRRTLADLSKRLGTLEHSLTVVATEIGVSGFPTFKHIDPREVYDEALRLARGQLASLETQIAGVSADLSRKIEQKSGQHDQDAQRHGTKLAELERRLHALAGSVAELAESQARRERAMPEGRLAKLETALDAIDLRIDTLWDTIETAAKAEAERTGARPAPQTPSQREIEAVLDRNRALEMRLIAQENSLSEMRDQIAGMAAYLQRGAGAHAPSGAPGGDIETLRNEVAVQVRAWLAHRLASDGGGPIAGPNDSGALIMSAAERAIVRLTHRIERLEEWRDSTFADSDRPQRPRGGLRRLLEG